MKLSNKSFKKLVKGACYFMESKGYLSCFHYSKKQLDYFSQTDVWWNERARYSSGVRAEFETVATEFSFDYKTNDSSGYNTIDVYCDMLATSVLHLNSEKGKASFTLPEGNKRVCIYFPTDCRFEMKNFIINGKYKAIRSKRPKVLLIGDSISQGYGTSMSGATYANSFNRKMRYDLLNQSIGGYRYDAGSIMKIDGFEPEKIIVVLGTNYHECVDYDYENDVIKFYEQLSKIYPNKPVLSVTPFWRGDGGCNMERLKWCISIINRECSKYPNIKVVDGFKLIPHFSECFSDNLHPNSYGAELIANNLADIVKKIKF